MLYKLPDGREIDLTRVKSVSSIRDSGLEVNSIEKSAMTFSIRLAGSETIEVKELYHYADWAEATLKIKRMRQDLLNKLKDVRGE